MLFRALFVCAAGFDAHSGKVATEKIFSEAMTLLVSRPPTSMKHRQIQRTEVQLKPETAKCYSRQLEPAIEIIFASHAPCVLRRKRVLVTERKAEEVVSQLTETTGTVHHGTIFTCSECSPHRHKQRSSPGLFVHTGVMELMARKRRFITRGDAVPVIDTGGIRFDAARHRFD